MSGAAPAAATPVVIDTNVVLDLLLFDDPAALALRGALAGGQLKWLATPAMRLELAQVLDREPLRRQAHGRGRSPDQVLGGFDGWAQLVEPPLRARVVCRDPDDQKFVDLAVAWRCLLLSKDRDLLCLEKRLAALQVRTATALSAHNRSSPPSGSAP